MKYIILYFLISIFLTFFSYVYKPFVTRANREIIKNVVFVSYPVINFLDSIKSLSGRYVFLLNLKKENILLQKKIVKLELQNRLLNDKENRIRGSKKYTYFYKHGIFKAEFKFKNNFNIDYVFLSVKKELDLNRNVCSVFSNNMNLIGIIDKKEKNFYTAKTVFNHSFVADVYIISDNSTYRALFIGDLYKPKAEFLIPNAKVKVGSNVYASGAFGVFPKGSLIGRVSKIENINNYYKIAYLSINKSFFNDWTVFVICIRKH